MSKKFDKKSTALEVVEGHDLTGYEIIVTGAASGIGVETVRALAKAGARCIIGARDLVKAESVAQELRKDTGNDKIEVEKLELDSLESVRDFVKRYFNKKRDLNILINNAGIMACPLARTRDGFESQLGTNHLGHFALTFGLLPLLKQTAKKTGKKSRVVSVSSLAHIYSDINLDDLNFNTREYDPWKAYGQSKTANALFSVALTKLYAHEGVISNSLMPGVIMTGLQKHMPREEQISKGLIDKDGNPINPHTKSVEQGAATSVWAAVAPEFDEVGGLYLEDCSVSELKTSFTEIHNSFRGYFGYIANEENALKLWNASIEMIEQASN